MSAQPVRFGVVAVGGIGSLHASNIATRVSGARLVAVTDIDGARAERVAAKHSALACASYADLLAREDVDAVVIAAPTPAHADLTVEALRAGKHVLCEKPLAGTLAEADRVAAAVEASGLVVQVGFQRRHDAVWRDAVRLVRSGQVGRPRLYFASYRECEPYDGDDLRALLIHGNIHDLDAARWLMGEIDAVSVIGQSFDATPVPQGGQAENLLTTLHFSNGAIGVIDNGTNARYGFECAAEVVGSEATVRITNTGTPPVELLRAGHTSTAHPVDSAQRFDLAYVALVEDFCVAVRGGQGQGASVADGRSALVLALAAETSLLEGRPVRLGRRGDGAHLEYFVETR